jgi:hypothetical protein
MRGFVTTKTLLVEARTIVAEFGLPCYARCWWRVLTRCRRCTFLECI